MINFKNSNTISKNERIFIIVHLCLCFTLVSWICLYPFMGEHFAIKFRSQITESIIYSPFFTTELSFSDQNKISSLHHLFSYELNTSFFNKFALAFKLLAFSLSPFERAWIAFSFVICLLLLFQKKGARNAVWLLPLITLFFSIDNRLSKEPSASLFENILPSEKSLVENYLDLPNSFNNPLPKQQLEKAWKLYLIDTYLKEAALPEEDIFDQQVQKGLFFFRIELANTLAKKSNLIDLSHYNQKLPIWILSFFFFWNVLFAYFLSIEPMPKKIAL